MENPKWTRRNRETQTQADRPHSSDEELSLRELAPGNVADDDIAMVYTRSGNTYLICRSKIRRGTMVITNTKVRGVDLESGHPFMLQRGSTTIAKVGEPLTVFAITDEAKTLGELTQSTPVIKIVILRGVYTERKEVPEDVGGFEALAKALRVTAHPKREVQ